MHDTIQALNSFVQYLNAEKNWKLAEKINTEFWSALKWERVRKSGCIELEQDIDKKSLTCNSTDGPFSFLYITVFITG